MAKTKTSYEATKGFNYYPGGLSTVDERRVEVGETVDDLTAAQVKDLQSADAIKEA